MDAQGFVAVCRNCVILKKNTFNDRQTGVAVYNVTVVGLGWTKVFRAETAEDFAAWPAEGMTVDIECQLENTANNTFKLIKPRCVVKDAAATSATSRQPARQAG